ncbi:MAG: metal-dependent hydrolase [Vicingaceae bacterium]
MKFTYLGHACFMIENNNHQLLFDPFITPNPLIENFDLNQLNPNYILISHGHEDHLADAETIAKKNNSKIISNYEIVTWYGAKGVEGHPMNHGGKWSFDFGTVKYVNAIHSSGLPDGSYGGQPGGFILDFDGKIIYYSGDTALFSDMQLFGEQYKIDLAVLPIGDNFTMGIEDAVLAAKKLNCKKVIGVHFNTFPYIEINKQEAINQFNSNGIELILLNIEESINI